MRFNKVCELEDFADPELAAEIRETSSYKIASFTDDFPKGAEHRKDWEVAMAVRTLRRFGALRPDATILGVAVGTEDTVFYLTRHVRQVFATDRYLFAEEWDSVAPMSMLVQPHVVAPYDFDPTRLVVQHMDGRSLRYPDDTFDAIFSSGSIEHFGDLQDVAASAYEMGRVLKPGGVLSVSTEFKLAGPPGGIGWPGATLVFSPEHLQRFVVEASGLVAVDDFHHDISAVTLATERSLVTAKQDHDERIARLGSAPCADEYAHWDFPHVVMFHDGYVFGSVHLALRKTEDYPAPANAWAKPSDQLLARIGDHNVSCLVKKVAESVPAAAPPAVQDPEPPPAPAPSWAGSMQRIANGAEQLASCEADLAAWSGRLTERLALVDDWANQIHEVAASVDRRHAELVQCARKLPADYGTRLGASEQELAPHWQVFDVDLPSGLHYKIVVDPTVGDPIADSFAAGHGISWADDDPVQLMLSMLQPDESVVDIGAHIGTFALAAAAAGCRVLAIEASPLNAALLRASAAVNGFSSLHVLRAAASDDAGQLSFMAHGPWGRVTAGDPGSEAVPAVTVDEVLFELAWGPPGFVKLDVEGSELRAIDGLKSLLAGGAAPPLLVESNGHTLRMVGATPEQLVDLLDGLGYTTYMVEPGALVRVRPGDTQPRTLVDLLALPSGVAPPAGRAVEPAMSPEERAARFLLDCDSPNPDVRVHIARVLSGEPADIVERPAIRNALRRFQTDPVVEVREAAAWWTPPTHQGRKP